MVPCRVDLINPCQIYSTSTLIVNTPTQMIVLDLGIPPVEAYSIDVKMLIMVLCSAHDVVPLKSKNENGQP